MDCFADFERSFYWFEQLVMIWCNLLSTISLHRINQRYNLISMSIEPEKFGTKIANLQVPIAQYWLTVSWYRSYIFVDVAQRWYLMRWHILVEDQVKFRIWIFSWSNKSYLINYIDLQTALQAAMLLFIKFILHKISWMTEFEKPV